MYFALQVYFVRKSRALSTLSLAINSHYFLKIIHIYIYIYIYIYRERERERHAGHCWRSKDELITDVLLWTPTYGRAKQDDQLEYTFSSYVRIRDVALKTYQRRWTIGRSGERGSGISVPVARHDDDIYI